MAFPVVAVPRVCYHLLQRQEHGPSQRLTVTGEAVGPSPSTSIAILHYSAPPVVGGVERVIRDQAEGLLSYGFRVKVVAARGSQWHSQIAFARVLEMDSLFGPALELQEALLKEEGHRSGDQFEALARAIASRLADALADCDVAIVHNIMTMHKNLPLVRAMHLLAEAPRSPRMVLWTHDIALLDPVYRDQIGQSYPWSLLRTPLRGATYVAVSELRRQELCSTMGLKASRIEVIPNGLDILETLQVSKPSRDLLARWGLHRRRPLVLMPARITRRKRLELALEALAILKERFPQIAAVVTGPPGPHNPASQRYVDELMALRSTLQLDGHAFFLQAEPIHGGTCPISDGTIYELMRLADAVLITSSHEGFGLPAVEAALLRTPLVTFPLEPIREAVGSIATYVEPPGGPEEVASALLKVLESGPSVQRRRLMESFDRDNIVANQVVPLLVRVLGEKA